MRNCAALAVGLSLMLAGCRDVTAPEAKNFAREMEKRVVKGDLGGLYSIFMFMGTLGQVHGMPMARNEALQITRDGVPMAINGFVVEEVLVAPGGIGKPYVRRSVVGWPSSEKFAVVATSDAHPGTFSLSSVEPEREAHLPFATLVQPSPGDTLRSWVPQRGTVDIRDAVVDRECGTKDHVPQVPHAAERVQCHFALYEVAVQGELVTLADYKNRMLRPFRHSHRLEIPRQQVPGIRFVTTCAERPDEPDLEEFDCLDPIRFWRDNSQYAPFLGVDFARMERARLPQTRWRAWAQGREISGVSIVPRWYARVEREAGERPRNATAIRWTIHAPDGRLIESGISNPDQESTSRRNFLEIDYFRQLEADVRKVQLIVPAQYFDPAASPYMVSVLTAEFTNP